AKSETSEEIPAESAADHRSEAAAHVGAGTVAHLSHRALRKERAGSLGGVVVCGLCERVSDWNRRERRGEARAGRLCLLGGEKVAASGGAEDCGNREGQTETAFHEVVAPDVASRRTDRSVSRTGLTSRRHAIARVPYC